MDESHRILVVDDDPDIRDLVATALRNEGFDVVEARDAASAAQAVDGADLIVLDIVLGDGNGLDVLAEVRRASLVPVILLTGKGDESDRVTGLDLGADDYMVKPFSPRELAARIRSVLRRTTPQTPAATVSFGELQIDRAGRRVLLNGEAVQLTRLEFDLLEFLALRPGVVFTRHQLLEQVWSSSEEWQDPATVTEHVRRLRHKLEKDPANPRWLHTVRGTGYLFEPAN